MRDYQREFIQLTLQYKVLQFGDFTLKSGRKSHYFFNAGLFNTGLALAKLGEFYARTILQEKLEFDIVFGPAYKGIPLVVCVAMALSQMTGENIPYAFNRKEVKQHGEGGIFIGAPLKNQRVLIIDDVITAGTAIQESSQLLKAQYAIPLAALVALDRQELRLDLDLPIYSIIKRDDLSDYVKN